MLQQRLHVTAAVEDAIDNDPPLHHPIDDPIGPAMGLTVFTDPEQEQFLRDVAALGQCAQPEAGLLDVPEHSIGVRPPRAPESVH